MGAHIIASLQDRLWLLRLMTKQAAISLLFELELWSWNNRHVRIHGLVNRLSDRLNPTHDWSHEEGIPF